ncbi:hypothetical protein M885DRAFT_623579 [Pelagophyceae sp. CCMP2097]|nr:hypothetical protein M885DRAFT_623579 [Pelagophyceae sp. CCMP2097]
MLRLAFASAAAVTAVLLGVAQRNGVSDGTLPLFHLVDGHGYSEAALPDDLSGVTTLITGASSGLGLGLAQVLARKGARLIVTARSKEKCDEIPVKIAACVVLELLSLTSTRKAAEEILELTKDSGIDKVVLNAGIMAPPEVVLSADGIESQFATNHLGHFELTRLLLPRLREQAASGRAPAVVVAISSLAHWFAPKAPLLTLDVLNDPQKYDKVQWYGWSKLCNILFVRELNAREPGVVAHSVHPGGVQGKLLRFAMLPDSIVEAFEKNVYWDAQTAALTIARPLFDAQFSTKAEAGTYFAPIARPLKTSAMAQDDQLASDLWKFSEALAATV